MTDWWVLPRPCRAEIEGGEGEGWRLVAESSEGDGPLALCHCDGGHPGPREAKACPDAQERAKIYRAGGPQAGRAGQETRS